MTNLDHEAVSRAVGEASTGPGGIWLVVRVFSGVPGVVVIPGKRGLLRSRPERIQIGDWRYEVTVDERLSAAHVVRGIVIAEEVLAAGAVGQHIARALGQVVSSHGPTVIPGIQAAIEVLAEAGPRP